MIESCWMSPGSAPPPMPHHSGFAAIGNVVLPAGADVAGLARP